MVGGPDYPTIVRRERNQIELGPKTQRPPWRRISIGGLPSLSIQPATPPPAPPTGARSVAQGAILLQIDRCSRWLSRYQRNFPVGLRYWQIPPMGGRRFIGPNFTPLP